jgi:hypothetical protein
MKQISDEKENDGRSNEGSCLTESRASEYALNDFRVVLGAITRRSPSSWLTFSELHGSIFLRIPIEKLAERCEFFCAQSSAICH